VFHERPPIPRGTGEFAPRLTYRGCTCDCRKDKSDSLVPTTLVFGFYRRSFGRRSFFHRSDSVRFVVLSNVSLCLYGMPNPKDRQDAELVVEVIKGAHKFTRESVLRPGSEPVFVTPGSRLLIVQPIVVKVYDVASRDDQNKIVDAVRNLVVGRLLIPVEISFIDHENWIVDGPNSDHRGAETQLRKVYITRSGIRDHPGNKLIKYPTP